MKKKKIVFVASNKIVVEPIRDFLEMGGDLQTPLKISPKKIREAFGDYLAKEAVGKIK